MGKEWHIVPSQTDPEMFAVESHYEYGELHPRYIVADNLPIEDATLIAAAPDMFEAIEETLQSAIKNRMHDSIEITSDAVEMLRAAIAKAKGGA